MTRSHQNRLADGAALIALDPWLAPYAGDLQRRYARFAARAAEIAAVAGCLADFARGHEYFGFNRGQHDGRAGVWYREWAPAAYGLWLIGDFNGWDRGANRLRRDDFGVWSVFLPDDEYAARLTHGGRVKLHVESAAGPLDRVPAYARRVVFDHGGTHVAAQYWQPPAPFAWKHAAPPPAAPRIYEAHVGMALEEERIGTYREFEQQVLPRIAAAGYNAVQLMAIQEHPYYASFGYQVSNFFAPSSRFGTPEELKALIDAAHGLGLRVFLDLVHSHSVKNLYDGLNRLDGTDFQYFHAGGRGEHPVWDSLLFDYGKWEVLRFLLSNVRYWLEEFRFDGFRFDGVTSMLYFDHGLGRRAWSYDDYLRSGVDDDAVLYLQLANRVAHDVNPRAVTIAEDVSGMVGLARPIDEGGIGFDYRLAMGIPDYWVSLLEKSPDERWPMGGTYAALLNRRRGEKHVAYAESHDQSLVGDKPLAFRLMDAAMYWHMNIGSRSVEIDRGIALHKLIRLMTFALGGEGYLAFMGNEFGHPEWIDFPREGNNWSYQYARRRWSLRDDPRLRYAGLAEFDRAMLALDERFGLLAADCGALIHCHEDDKLLIAQRGPLVIAINLHPHHSQTGLRIGVPEPHDHVLVLDSDAAAFGGHGHVSRDQVYPLSRDGSHGRPHSVQIYLPARSGQVLAPCR